MATVNAINLVSSGVAVYDGSGTFSGRTLTATASTGIQITNGDGVSGNPTFAGINATSSTKGVATFDENDFLVTSADVAVADRTRLYHGWTKNIGIAYSSGTFTVQGADGNSLSSTNKGWVALESVGTPGEIVLHEITSNSSFDDSAGTSDIVNNLFGVTTGDDWGANDIPFWLYACADTSDTNPVFAVVRMPNLSRCPVTAEIGTPSSAVADEGYSMFIMDSVTASNYNNASCAPIGCFRMRFTQPGGADDWTVQSLQAGKDGIGNFHGGEIFTFPTGVMGASSGTHIQANGGTAPVFSTTTVNYWVDRDALVTVDYITEGDGGTDGSGSVTSWMTLPWQGFSANLGSYVGTGIMQTPSGTWHIIAQIDSAARFATAYQGTTSSSTFNQNGDFTNGSRQMRAHLQYYMRRT
jgi:hypothetical protein